MGEPQVRFVTVVEALGSSVTQTRLSSARGRVFRLPRSAYTDDWDTPRDVRERVA
jgi:hypothetical protein